MHGIIFAQLNSFVVSKFGQESWTKILKESGLGDRIYMATTTYPDEEIVKIVTGASSVLGKDANSILEAFGQFLVPGLMRIYGSLVKPNWKTLDLLEHVEETIHAVVRARNPGADPPALECTRVSEREVQIVYRSKRKMCAFAKGMVTGVSEHFKEIVSIAETACMHKGAANCTIVVRRP